MANSQSIPLSVQRMPRWSIVALISRIARHRQDAFQDQEIDDKIVVDNAIRAAETSARNGVAVAQLSEIETAARNVAKLQQQPQAAHAAHLAADAAHAASLDGQLLSEIATQAIASLGAAISSERLSLLLSELKELSALSYGLPSYAAAPSELLDFVHQQAVHEAGHVVASWLLGLLCDWAQLIYEPHVAPFESPFTHTPLGVRPGLTDDDRCKYRIFYAAGAAADRLLGTPRDWAALYDKECHDVLGGTDFELSIAEAQQLPEFQDFLILDIASLLEAKALSQAYPTSDPWMVQYTDFEPIFEKHGIPHRFNY